jgi:hypothetical protein
MKTELDQYRDWLVSNQVAAELAVDRALAALEQTQQQSGPSKAFDDAMNAFELAHRVNSEIIKSLEHISEYRLWQKVQKLAA